MTRNQNQMRRAFLSKSAAIAATASVMAGASSQGVLAAAGQPAPEWDLSGWLNGDGGSIAGNKGKIILIQIKTARRRRHGRCGFGIQVIPAQSVDKFALHKRHTDIPRVA